MARRLVLNVEFSPKHREFLNSGVIYTYGRDSFMRPIVVMNMCAMIKLIRKHG